MLLDLLPFLALNEGLQAREEWMKFLTYIVLDVENVWFPHTKHRQSTISFRPVPITLIERGLVCTFWHEVTG